MTHTVSRTHDTLAHVLDAQGRRVSRHDLISDAYAEAERLNSKETTMPVETSETMALVAKVNAALPQLFRSDGSTRIAEDVVAICTEHFASANAQLERERDALRDEWREIAAGLTTDEPEIGALWPMVAEITGSLAAVRLHFKNEVAAHNATKAERDAVVRERDEAVNTLFTLRNRAGCGPDQSGPDVWEQCDAATAALAKAEGERDRLRDALIGIEEYWNGAEGSAVDAAEEMSYRARAALTPAPEAPKDGE